MPGTVSGSVLRGTESRVVKGLRRRLWNMCGATLLGNEMKLVYSNCHDQENVPEALEIKVRQGAALGVAPGRCAPPAPLPMQCKRTLGSARVHLGHASSAGLLHASLVTLKFQHPLPIPALLVSKAVRSRHGWPCIRKPHPC